MFKAAGNKQFNCKTIKKSQLLNGWVNNFNPDSLSFA